jgi:hypothetical protein
MSTQTLDQPTTPVLDRTSRPARYTPRPALKCIQQLEAAGLRYFTTPEGEPRVFVAMLWAFTPGAALYRVMIDRSRIEPSDNRVVGYLFPEEPASNVVPMCGSYLEHPNVSPNDVPLATLLYRLGWGNELETCQGDLTGNASEVRYRLVRAIIPPLRIPQLRWWRCVPLGQAGPGYPVVLRDVCGATQTYSPYLAETTSAIEQYQDDPEVSIVKLREERCNLVKSPIVLNRGLREAVQARVNHGTSLSQIAQNCGRRINRKGQISGETSWLSRRMGVMPDGGKSHPTPWIHTDVLNLIAEKGLQVPPHEVEVA